MALKTFLLYIGSFFAGSAALLAVVKSLVLNFNIKKPAIYGVLASAITSLIGFGILFATENPTIIYWMVATLFFLFGLVHVLYTHNRFFNPKKPTNKVYFGELLFAASVLFFTVVAFSSLLYFFKDKSFMFYPVLMSALFFFIPLLFSNMFRVMYGIPAANYVTWQYPLQPIELPDEKEGEKLLVIGFEIAKKATDAHTYFRAKAPEQMALGELYYHFINDYNDLQSETPIHYTDTDNEMDSWWFRLKPKWYQRNRILDPFSTIAENGIKENSVIICERLAE